MPRYWNESVDFFIGCTKATAACDRCWACRQERGRLKHLNRLNGADFWDGPVRQPAKIWCKPLHWKRPRVVAVCFRSDLFHEAVDDKAILKALTIMYACSHHTFVVTTKRASRMGALLAANDGKIREWTDAGVPANLWLGASAHDQATADAALAVLGQLKAAGWHTWLSLEPMLGPVRLPVIAHSVMSDAGPRLDRAVDGIIVGGESGKGWRFTGTGWIERVRDECSAAGVRFAFKQWGGGTSAVRKNDVSGWPLLDGRTHQELPWAKEGR